MHYSLFHGAYTPLADRLARTGGTLLPFAALVVLVLAFGTSTVYQAAGKHPQIQASKPAVSTNEPATKQTASSPPATQAGGTNTSASSSASNQASASSTLPAGGYGGGGATSGATTTSTSTTSTGLPPSGTTTVTVPGQDLSAGGKTIVSTSPLTLTVN